MHIWMRLTVVFLFLTAFGRQAAAEELPTFSVVGISNRVDVTDGSGAAVGQFDIVVDVLIDHLLDSNRLAVYDASAYIQRFVADERALPLKDEQFMSAIQEVDTDYIIYGFVDVLSIESSRIGYEDSTYSYARDGGTVRAVLSVTVVNTKTGRPVFTATGNGKSGVSMTGVGYSGHLLSFGKKTVPEECVYNALEKAAHEITDKILRAMR